MTTDRPAIELLQFDLARIEAVRHDPAGLDGIPVVPGGLPPAFILDRAVESLRDGKPALWFSPQAFIDVVDGRVVGSGAFKGEPDDGWVEIGYGIANGCAGRGYATSGVVALVALGFAQPGVRAIYAETEVANIASQRVVRKVGFRYVGERDSDDHGLVDCWLLERPDVAR